MRYVLWMAFIAGTLSLPLTARAQQPVVTLDRLVSVERQNALGLDKLTSE